MRDGVKEGVGVAAGARTILVLVPEVILQAVVRTRGFHELSDTVLARVLRSDRLAVDELDLVQAVREWAHVSSVSAAQRGRGVPKTPPRCPMQSWVSYRPSWGARCPRWPPCPCGSCACPCWHPASWRRWRATTSGTCSSR